MWTVAVRKLSEWPTLYIYLPGRLPGYWLASGHSETFTRLPVRAAAGQVMPDFLMAPSPPTGQWTAIARPPNVPEQLPTNINI